MNVSYKKPAIAILFATALLVLAATLAGCKAKPIAGGVAAGKPLGRIEGHAQAALFSVEQAKPISTPLALPSLNSATENLKAIVHVDVPDATAEAEKSEALVADLTAKNGILDDHFNNDWFSQKQKRLALKITIIAVSTWALLGTLGIVLGKFGLAKWSIRIMRVLPFANVFAWIRDRMTGTVMLPVKERRSVFIEPQLPDPPTERRRK